MKGIVLLFIVLLFPFLKESFAQKSINATLALNDIEIDGSLDEADWMRCESGTEFIQLNPKPYSKPSGETEIRVLYDQSAIYFGFICYDDPSLISKVLSKRDDFNASIDHVQVLIDTYNDDQNGFVFGVSSAGVQYDSKAYKSDETMEVNMVWKSQVLLTEKGWQAEIKIPYSALRFPETDVQNWGINFFRTISRNREISCWNPLEPGFENYPAQCGDLYGVEGITPPLRLALIPYLSAYLNHYPSSTNPNQNWSRSFNGGMDIKLGLNEAFTMDITLVPDFNQVVFDNNVLNLSPFEIQFNENRQFFTEGTELFNKAGLFYSRRIGVQAPSEVLYLNIEENERLLSNLGPAQLYNATKISGRTKKGLGIGVFNGITAEQKSRVKNISNDEEYDRVVSPLTDYNVLVLDQNLKNNSFINLTSTNVWRSGSAYDANVTGFRSVFNSSDNKFYIASATTLSSKLYAQSNIIGHNYGTSVGKQTGAIIYDFSYFEESDKYDPNDLGFNTNNNKRILGSTFSYRIFKPFWKLNMFSSRLELLYNRLYYPNVYNSTELNASAFASTKKFHACGYNFNASLTDSYDYFEPRSPGSYFKRPQYLVNNLWISSNYQSRLALDAFVRHSVVNATEWFGFQYGISPRIRVNDRLFIVYDWNESFLFGDRGFAVQFNEPLVDSDQLLFSNRDRRDVVNTITVDFSLTNLMNISFKMRHYRSAVKTNYFYSLDKDGGLTQIEYNGVSEDGTNAYDINYNAFTIDCAYRWVFQPGSEISVVWKNSIFSSDKKFDESYLSNVNRMFDYGAANSFSIKFIYWLDYQYLKRKSS